MSLVMESAVRGEAGYEVLYVEVVSERHLLRGVWYELLHRYHVAALCVRIGNCCETAVRNTAGGGVCFGGVPTQEPFCFLGYTD